MILCSAVLFSFSLLRQIMQNKSKNKEKERKREG
jgi:hypothetical protein